MIDETFGHKVSVRTINRFRNEIKLEFRAPINSVFLSPAEIEYGMIFISKMKPAGETLLLATNHGLNRGEISAVSGWTKIA